jgi:hypothetical protein
MHRCTQTTNNKPGWLRLMHKCTRITNSKPGWLMLMHRPFMLAHSHRYSTHHISQTILCILRDREWDMQMVPGETSIISCDEREVNNPPATRGTSKILL